MSLFVCNRQVLVLYSVTSSTAMYNGVDVRFSVVIFDIFLCV